MNKYKVLATGSTGNAVLYHNSILVDIGVAYSKIKPYKSSIQVVLISHIHGDHLKIETLNKLQFDRPGVRILCGEFIYDSVKHLRNVDVLDAGVMYDYGSFEVSPIKLYHDVENFGFRIYKDRYKIIHCTDTAHLEGITAKDYDLYAIEYNHEIEELESNIIRKKQLGIFCHELGAANSHLSDEQAKQFIYNNRKPSSEILQLHKSSSRL